MIAESQLKRLNCINAFFLFFFYNLYNAMISSNGMQPLILYIYFFVYIYFCHFQHLWLWLLLSLHWSAIFFTLFNEQKIKTDRNWFQLNAYQVYPWHIAFALLFFFFFLFLEFAIFLHPIREYRKWARYWPFPFFFLASNVIKILVSPACRLKTSPTILVFQSLQMKMEEKKIIFRKFVWRKVCHDPHLWHCLLWQLLYKF